MNEYLEAIQTIKQYAEQLIASEGHSLEIKQSATTLRQSVQPCLKELEQSATRLKRLVLVCSDDLYQAENVWLSKPMIAGAAKDRVWEQLGELSGYHFRIRLLSSQCKFKAIEQSKKYWEEKVEILRRKWFVDGQGKPKKAVGWGEKDGFIKDVRSDLQFLSPLPKINIIVRDELNKIYQEIKQIDLLLISKYASLLDQKAKTDFNKQVELIVSEVEAEFDISKQHLYGNAKIFNDAVKPNLENLANIRGDISWEEVIKFREKISIKIGDIVSLIFDNKVKILNQIIEKAIAFYNDFLERQERYQQETPEQRQAEKDWIEQQRQEIERIQKGIEAVLNPTAE